MNNAGQTSDRSAAEALRIDAICDDFERAWKEGAAPRIEEYLGKVGPAAFRELLQVEVELRRQRQEHVSAEDYQQRFAGFEAVVRDVCRPSDVLLATDVRDEPALRAEAETYSHRHSHTRSGHLEVRCPNCHEPTEVAVDTTLTDLTCSACGSHFSLVDQSQATRMAPALSKLGRFELIERIGVGGFGSVWKALDKELDRTVAVKIPRAGDMTP